MDFLQQLQNFTKGDIQQGKWMIGVEIIFLLPLAFLLFKNNLSLQIEWHFQFACSSQ